MNDDSNQEQERRGEPTTSLPLGGQKVKPWRSAQSVGVGLSVILPVLRPEPAVFSARRDLAELDCVHEIIFVSPEVGPASSAPQSPQVGDNLPHYKMRHFFAPLGRASQMNMGAARAKGAFLLFLHGDTEVELDGVWEMAASLACHPAQAHVFSLAFASRRRSFKWLSRMAAARDRISSFPLGDQGLGVSRDAFLACGGYPDVPFMEDVVMARRFRRRSGFRILKSQVRTSPDQFERGGLVRTLLRNGLLVGLFLLGIPPRTLVRFYYGQDYLNRWSAACRTREQGRKREPADDQKGEGRPPAPVPKSGRQGRWWSAFYLPLLGLILLSGNALAVDHSHALFDSVLTEFVTEGRVDYQGLKEDMARPASRFSRYLVQLGHGTALEEANWTREQRLAYWINAYNAFTLKLITDHHPLRPRWYMHLFPFLKAWLPLNSILQIKGRWDGITFLSVRGPVTLDHIEHQILRPEFADPRIHFAIVCASVGCPRLQSRAFRPESLDRELERVAVEFVSSRSQVEFDSASDAVRISKIFQWFGEDFQVPVPPDRPRLGEVADRYGKNAGVVRWLAAYGPPALRARLKRGPFRLGYRPYNWNLNEWVNRGRPLALGG